MPDTPANFAELLQEWPQIQEDIAFVRQLRQLTILLNTGSVRLQYAEGAENAVLDIRDVLDTEIEQLLTG